MRALSELSVHGKESFYCLQYNALKGQYMTDRWVTVAAIQMACSWDRQANINKVEPMIRAAVADGANIILLQKIIRITLFLHRNQFRLFAIGDAFGTKPKG